MHRKGRTGRKRNHRKKLGDCSGCCRTVAQFIPGDILLLKWAKRNGITFGKLRPARFPLTGRGLMTCKKLKMGDILISVPETMLITTKKAQESEIGELLIKRQAKSRLSAVHILCAFLLNEKYRGERSFWHPYITTLPRSFNTPAYFSPAELRVLPPSFHQQCVLQARTVYESYKELKKCLKSCVSELDKGFLEFCSYDEFKWAWFVVNTRSVYKPNDEEKPALRNKNTYALAPVLDLLNHSDKAEVTAGFNELNHKYEIHTSSPYHKYSQVFINYGPHGNKKLLLEYGFVLPQNLHNTVDFSREMFYSTVMANMAGISRKKKEVIRANNLDGDLCCTEENGLSWSVMVVLKILAMSEDAFRSDWQKALRAEPFSQQVESKVWRWVQTLVRCVLKSYETGDQRPPNDDALQDGRLSVNMQLALLLRRQEEQILMKILLSFPHTSL